MKVFDVARSRDIERLQKQIEALRSDLNELRERTYFPHHYGPELYINDAVQAIADHLHIKLVPEPSQFIPRSAKVVPTAFKVPEKKTK